MTADPSLTVQSADALADALARTHGGVKAVPADKYRADALLRDGVVAVRKPLPDELRDLADDPMCTFYAGGLRDVADYVEQQATTTRTRHD